MYIVKINDGYCEWTYKFDDDGKGEFCIQDIADAISKAGLKEIDVFLSEPCFSNSNPEASVNKNQ